VLDDRENGQAMKNENLAAIATGVIVGRVTAPHSRVHQESYRANALSDLSLGQRRVAIGFGQVVGNLVCGVFLGYVLLVMLCVLR
jgi:hypothetical protein